MKGVDFLDADAIELIGQIGTMITSVWTSLLGSAGAVVIISAAAGIVISYSIAAMWRIFSKRKGRKN